MRCMWIALNGMAAGSSMFNLVYLLRQIVKARCRFSAPMELMVLCRFSKTAGLIVGRMGANINHMAAAVKRGYEKLRDEASGGGKRDR